MQTDSAGGITPAGAVCLWIRRALIDSRKIAVMNNPPHSIVKVESFVRNHDPADRAEALQELLDARVSADKTRRSASRSVAMA